ncbi:YihY family inner membrane protein [uncultured Microbulbifer sp.]|uniref:YihY family inner membrane protein n=1 Tax=uncultured Microbulbifer sp. TaxID=348147 RepID=UPI002631F786|nr:YihY family inner membrane protein [uncultured Microbulbifer sp.]
MQDWVNHWRRFAVSLWTLFNEKGCQRSAAALTYITLFGIVPLVTVSYAMLSLFPDFAGLQSKLQEQIFSHFVPQSGREVQEYISSFSTQAQRLTGVGIAMLIVTSGLVLRSIEGTFNSIWDVSRGRSGVSSFLLYWAILSLGPILLGAGLAASTYLLSQKLFLGGEDGLGLMAVALRLLPFIFTSAIFTLLFTAVPNCYVPLRHGIEGGVITSIAFEVMKYLFGVIVARSSVQAIYGAFAFVPLFLLWIYLMWMLVLAGCVLVRTLSMYQSATQGRRHADLVATLIVLWQLYTGGRHGQPLRERDIALMGIKFGQWRRLSKVLQDHGVLTRTDRNDYVLMRDLNTVPLMELTAWLSPQWIPGGIPEDLPGLRWYSEVERRLANTRDFAREQLKVTIGALFKAACDREDAAQHGAAPAGEDNNNKGETALHEGGSDVPDNDKRKAEEHPGGSFSVLARRNKRL